MTETITFAEMEPAHLAAARSLSAAIGWPHRTEDWADILTLSRGVVAFDGGRLVGTAICSLYPDRARLNMVIVAPEMRGRGLGRRIVETALACAGDLPMSLIATDDGYPLYERLGFVPHGEIAQWQGIVTALPPAVEGIRKGSAADLDEIAAMDRAAGSPDRRVLLAALLRRGTLWRGRDGFAITAAFGRGTTLGPMVARDLPTARALLATAAQGRIGSFLRLDIDPAHGLAPDLAAMGLSDVGGGRVMHRGAAPSTADFTNFSLASQALG